MPSCCVVGSCGNSSRGFTIYNATRVDSAVRKSWILFKNTRKASVICSFATAIPSCIFSHLPFIPRFVTRLKTIALGLNFFRRTHCLAVEYTRAKFNIVHKSNKKWWPRDSNPRQNYLLVFSGQRSNPLRHESYTLECFAFNTVNLSSACVIVHAHILTITHYQLFWSS